MYEYVCVVSVCECIVALAADGSCHCCAAWAIVVAAAAAAAEAGDDVR